MPPPIELKVLNRFKSKSYLNIMKLLNSMYTCDTLNG